VRNFEADKAFVIRRYAQWRTILGTDDVPLTQASARTEVLGTELVRVHNLDLRSLSPEQRQRLVDWIKAKFSTPPEEIERQLGSVGFPIREEDVTVTLIHDRYGVFL
jgi:hypothetical protein